MKTLLVPHPVLLPEGTDYKEDLKFDMSLPNNPQHTLDGDIVVPVKFDLNSKFIRGLMRDKKARMTVVVKCARTYERMILGVDDTTCELKIPLGRYADKIILSPYISATVPIKSFKSKEHHAEFSGIEINLPTGAILARGSDAELTIDALMTLSAAIRLHSSHTLEKGQYAVDVEDDFIEISMHEETYRDVVALRRTNPGLLYPSVYMTALTHAIQNVTPDGTRKWEESLRKTLEKRGIDTSNEDDLKSSAYVHAQQLLKYPTKFITGSAHSTEMEVGDDE